jgi:hypothetical protein
MILSKTRHDIGEIYNKNGDKNKLTQLLQQSQFRQNTSSSRQIKVASHRQNCRKTAANFPIPSEASPIIDYMHRSPRATKVSHERQSSNFGRNRPIQGIVECKSSAPNQKAKQPDITLMLSASSSSLKLLPVNSFSPNSNTCSEAPSPSMRLDRMSHGVRDSMEALFAII